MGTLAAMFVASGAPKLRSPFASALAMLRFGVLRRIRPWAGRALGGVEVLVGAAVAVLPNPFWPAVAALVLLGVFTGLIVAALARGRSFDCACFGGGERISWATVLRNLVFVAAAAGMVVATRPGSGVVLPGADERLLGLLAGALVMCAYTVFAALAALRPFATTLDETGAVGG